jgi:hypothetical protein
MHPIIDFEPYYSLLDEQEEIGWKQLHLGRYGLTWDRCQRRYLELKHQKPVSGEPKWIRHTIRETWAYHRTRWLARNEALHGPSNGKHTSTATRLALLTRIQALYNHEETLLVQDRHPFQIDIEEWETKSSASMRQWIKTNTAFIKHALQVATIQHKRNASDIRKFLPNFIRLPAQLHKKVSRRKKIGKSRDIRTFTSATGQKNTRQPQPIKPPTPDESRVLYPKQYKQASIIEFTSTSFISSTPHIAAPTI